MWVFLLLVCLVFLVFSSQTKILQGELHFFNIYSFILLFFPCFQLIFILLFLSCDKSKEFYCQAEVFNKKKNQEDMLIQISEAFNPLLKDIVSSAVSQALDKCWHSCTANEKQQLKSCRPLIFIGFKRQLKPIIKMHDEGQSYCALSLSGNYLSVSCGKFCQHHLHSHLWHILPNQTNFMVWNKQVLRCNYFAENSYRKT